MNKRAIITSFHSYALNIIEMEPTAVISFDSHIDDNLMRDDLGVLEKSQEAVESLSFTDRSVFNRVSVHSLLGLSKKIQHIPKYVVMPHGSCIDKLVMGGKTLGSPNLYEATPLEEVLEMLIKAKSNQYAEILKEAELLKKSYNDRKRKIQTNEYYFGEVRIRKFSKKAHLKGISEACKIAQKNIDLLVNKKTFVSGVILFPECHLRCLERGVKYRLITEVEDVEYIKKKLNQFLRLPNFEIRLINYSPLMGIAITDNKYVALSLIPNKGVGNTTFLGSNNTGLIGIALNQFDTIWNKAKKINFNIIKAEKKY